MDLVTISDDNRMILSVWFRFDVIKINPQFATL
jgi:hypothetical protein